VKPARKFVNEISDLGLTKVCSLIGSATIASEPIPTATLLRQSGLTRDPHTGRGALKMAEVLGLVHATRGLRKALLWQRGQAALRRDPGLPDLFPFRRLRDLLQHYRSSLIGTPDLLRDAELTNRREGLGALKALHVLGYVEIGKLNEQTVAWRWTEGRGEARTYQRGHFKREREPLVFEEEMICEGGTVRWPWIPELVHREWLLQAQADGFGEVAETDGHRRYRPPSAPSEMFGELLIETLRKMPERVGRAVVATLLRGWGPEETAALLGVSVSTVRRDTESGLAQLRWVLIDAGFAPATEAMLSKRDDLARCA
jgi:hypothetical protein